MSSAQIISEIQKIIEQMPEKKLSEVLKFLQSAQEIDHQKLKLAQDFNQILKEDRNLLKRLAQ